MNLKSILKTALLTALFGIFIMLTSVAVAILITRSLPMTMFLANNASAINSAPGAHFVNAIFPVPGQAASAGLRARWSPLLPVFVGVSIARKFVKPLDAVLNKVFPPNQSAPLDVPNINDMVMPNTDQGLVDGISGIAAGDTNALTKQSGKVLNISLSFLFLIIVIICLFFTVALIRKLLYMGHDGSKKLVRSGFRVSEEIQALPETLDAIYGEQKKTYRRKSSSRSSK